MDDELNKRGSWEQAWQKALDEPSIAPSSRVWQGLEHSLMEQQLGRYKKRLALYQGLAAASVVLLGLWAGWWALVAEPSLQPAAQPLATTEISTSVPAAASASSSETPAASASRTTGGNAAASGSTAPYFSTPGLSLGYARSSLPPAGSWSGSRFHSPLGSGLPASAGVGLRAYYGAALYPAEGGAAALDEQPGESLLPQSAGYLRAIEAELALQDASLQVVVQPVALAQYTAAAQGAAVPGKDKKKPLWQSNGNVWLGASLASTFFSPNIGVANNSLQNFMNQQPVTKDGQVYTANMASWNAGENSLPSVDFRLEAAFRIRPRWMVQTSLEYNTYRVGTLAGTFYNHADEQNYPLYFSNFSYDKLQLASPNSRTAQPIQALTTYSFVRLPLGLNYVLLDRTFGLALSSALATDVFLGSTLADRENRLQEYTIAAGNASPFNRLHFSGQLGLQLYYRAGHNYLLTLEPSYRHALSDFSKSNSHFHSRPSTFGVAAGFRFILR